MKKILKWLIDFVMCYVFSIIFLIPFVNVAMLRTLMKDSKELNKRIKNKKTSLL